MNKNSLEKQVALFEKQTNIKLNVIEGKINYKGSLDLYGTGITSLPDNLTVGGSLDLRGTGITSRPDNLTVGDYLDLRGTGITSLPDNLTVGGYLDLHGTGITSLPDNLTVGDYLDLRDTGITSLPDNLTVGGSLDLRGTGITNKNVNTVLSADARMRIACVRNKLLTWEWNGRKYIKIDGVFSVVDSSHGNVFHVHQLGKSKSMYVVTDGENHWAHGDSLKEARADLIYKINDRDTSEYTKLNLDDTMTFEEAIAAYRTITGACAAGTRDYVENRLPKPYKEKYTVREMIELTKGEYQAETFKNFFTHK